MEDRNTVLIYPRKQEGVDSWQLTVDSQLAVGHLAVGQLAVSQQSAVSGLRSGTLERWNVGTLEFGIWNLEFISHASMPPCPHAPKDIIHVV